MLIVLLRYALFIVCDSLGILSHTFEVVDPLSRSAAPSASSARHYEFTHNRCSSAAIGSVIPYHNPVVLLSSDTVRSFGYVECWIVYGECKCSGIWEVVPECDVRCGA